MLSNEELDAIAESRARAEERRLSTAGNQLRLEVVKHCDTDDPPGAYYSTEVIEPSGGYLFGSGGFFVNRSTGAVEAFGSGELFEAFQHVYAHDRTAPHHITAEVVKVLFRQRTSEATPPYAWARLGKRLD